MPTTGFDPGNVRQSATAFPKLKLAKDEKARIVLIESNPTYEFAHNLQAPKLSPTSGKPLLETRKRKDRDTGEMVEYQDYAMEWIGTPICLGDPDVLMEKGVDPDNCPACAESVSSEHVYGPNRRFAVHILQYGTKPGSTIIAEPFSVQTKVWTLNEGRYAKLTQLYQEAGDGTMVDPRTVDLCLGPCESPMYQNYEIHRGNQCEMLKSEDRQRTAILTYNNNHAEDLSAYCGKRTEKRWVQNDVDKIRERWLMVQRGGTTPPQADFSQTLNSSILDTSPTSDVTSAQTNRLTASRADAPPGEGHAMNEFLPGGSAQDVAPSAPGDDAPASSSPSTGSSLSFSELIDNLKKEGQA